MPKSKKAPQPTSPKKRCVLCGEDYDDSLDPYHLEACRDARKP